MMNFLSKKILVFALLAVLVFVGWKVVFKKDNSSNVRTVKVVREDLIQRVTIPGTAEALRTTSVAAPYDGYIKKLYVKLGDPVKANDPIVSISQSLQASESVFPVRSPFSGTVTQLHKTEGQFVKTADTTPILRIDDTTKMFIKTTAPEIDAVKVKIGLEAVIKVSALPGKSYSGVVKEIAQSATLKEQWGSRGQVEFNAVIEIQNPDDQVKPGMSAIVDIVTSKKENVLVLPHEFIQSENNENHVTLSNGQKRSIKIGVQNESVTEVLEGLTEGESVQQIDFLQLIGK